MGVMEYLANEIKVVMIIIVTIIVMITITIIDSSHHVILSVIIPMYFKEASIPQNFLAWIFAPGPRRRLYISYREIKPPDYAW